MPAPPMPIDVPFGPLDTKSDPFSMPPGYLTVAENATAQTPNSYTTRLPYSQLAAGPSAAVAAVLRGSEMLACDGQQLWSFDPNASIWLTPGRFPRTQVAEARPTRRTVARNQNGNLIRPTVATATNGVTAVAWLDGSFVNCLCFDTAGQVIFGPVAIDLSNFYANVRLAAVGNTIVMFALSTTSTKVIARRLDTTVRPLSWGIQSTISTDVHASSIILDAWPVGSNVAIIWAKSTGIQTGLVDPTTLTLGTNIGQAATLTASSGGAITGTTGENIYAAWWDSVAGLKMWVLTTALASSSGPTVVDSYTTTAINQVGMTRSDSTHVMVAWNRATNGQNKRSDAVTRDRIRWCTASNTVSLSSIVDFLDLSLVSKPFSYSGSFYLHSFFDSTLSATQATNFLLRVSPDGSTPSSANRAQPACMDQYRQAARDGVASGLSDVVQITAGRFSTALPTAQKYLSSDTALTAVDLETFDLLAGDRFQSAQIGSIALIAGGIGVEYDGNQTSEVQFLTFPEGHTLTAATSGGSMADGTYQYILIYEWTDFQGNTHQSTTSLPKSVTISGGAGAGKVTVGSIPAEPNLDLRPGTGILASIFRTTPSISVGVYVHVTSFQVQPGDVPATFVDTASDASISTNRQIYITGGVLDKEPPLPSTTLITHQNAIWGVSSEDQQLLFYSGDYFPSAAPWFSSGFQIRCDTGGAITALASLDDKVIIFKSDRIFYVSGNRPNALGTGSSLTNPQLISSDVGCSEPRSIVRVAEGIYFLTSKGLYLIDRGLNVVYIGAPMEGYVQHYANCVAAVLLPNSQEIRWEFTGPDGTQPWSQVARKIVYNYGTKRWTTHLNYNSLVPVTATGGVGVRYTWFTSAGVAYQEATAAGTDPGGTFIPMQWETAWLSPTGPQGLTRVQYAIILGARRSAHGLLTELARNYDNTYAQSITFPDTSALPNDQRSWNIPEQQGESFRFRFTTTADNSSGQGFGASMTAVGVRLVALAKRGSFNKFMSATAKG